jgi:uncharacterized membrane protein YgcG
MYRPVLRCAMIAATIMFSSHAAFAESRMALVIGQSAYRAVVALPNPANDAREMSKLLGDAGFEVITAPDLSQNEMREKVAEFAAKVALKGPDTVALVFYAGHGVQIDGENFLMPVDVDPKREADIPLQAVRLNDLLNTLTSVPTRMRIVLLDACRNNPFPEINKTAGHGLAIVDAKVGASGTFLSFSTSPGAEAEDGRGADSPYTTALLAAAREPGLSIEDAFKRVRVSVNKATEGRQTPWESSSLTDDFRFFPTSTVTANEKQPVKKRTVEEWRHELNGKQVETANEIMIADGSAEAYEAFVALYANTTYGPYARLWLDRHRRMVAWNNALIINTAAAFRDFLLQFPDSDLTATARKLEDRTRNRPNLGSFAALTPAPTPVSLAGPACPCITPAKPTAPLQKASLPPKADPPSKKRVIDPVPPKRANKPPPRRPPPDDDEVVDRRPPPRQYDPLPGAIVGGAIGGVLGSGVFGGGGGRGGGYGGGRGGGYGGGGGGNMGGHRQ